MHGIGLAIRRQVKWQRDYISAWVVCGLYPIVVKHLVKLSHEFLGKQTLYLPAYSSRKWLEKAKVLGPVGYYWLPFVLQKINSGKKWVVSSRDWVDTKGLRDWQSCCFWTWKCEREDLKWMILRDKHTLKYFSWTKIQLWNKAELRMLPPYQYQLIARWFQGLRH